MDGTILGQGSFVTPATIVNRVIAIPSGADWLEVFNYTQFGLQGGAAPSLGVKYYWQRGMAAGTGIVMYKEVASPILSGDTLVSGGFTLYDPSGQTAGAVPLLSNPRATTASTNAVRPVVSTGDTSGVSVGTVVRLSNTAQDNVNGIDMVVGAVTPGVSFTLLTATNPLANAPGVVGGAGFYRIVNNDALFYPRRRYVVEVTNAAGAQVSTSVEHSFTPGQEVRFYIPAEASMTELNSTAENNYRTAVVFEVIDAYNFIINIDTSAFAGFQWPTDAETPCDFPIVVPVGESTAASLILPLPQTPLYQGEQVYNSNSGILADSTVNTGFLGMVLGTGGDGVQLGAEITGPAGSAAADVVYWRCGKSSFGGL